MSRWEGRSWVTLGDSISAAGVYQPIVAKALGFGHVDNLGKSGCTMTAGGERNEGATVHVGRRLERSYDCVTIFAGTNDYRLNRPLGSLEDDSLYTFCGAYIVLIEALLTANPACRLNLWTPLQRDKDGYDSKRPNELGHRLTDYAQAIREIGRTYALPVLDLHEESGFNKLTLDHLTTDRLHPNEAGHARIAQMAIAFLNKL
ncbi:Lysophospholipase L1 [Paenibacillus sp. UNCCL117]|uniref:SGNH/GDSL hydrolase family protein n=1 Tax=unclassified Paenibacillus TaxID=185978 RepID=UPI000886FE65|nr:MULTISPECIES: SGNH/GDSL hydrolase family protein [unclassified Paenibacillus]SDE25634.1 Lysophospholipase L1 [Paenibacillus sp. cl123]SFW62459.1 Lysophospholipase L1 [Paenibacillus sp. UNCCL117]